MSPATHNTERYDKLEQRVDQLEKDWIRTGEQIKTLFESTRNLKQVVYTFAFLLLLTVIYGAIGANGFNAITNNPTTQTERNATK